MACDEGWVHAFFFDEFADERVDDARVGEGWGAFYVYLLEDPLEEVVCLLRVEFVAGWEFLACGFLQGGDHLDALPGRGPVDVVGLAGLRLVCGLVRAGDLLDETGNELLGQVHHVVDIRERPVELAGGEFGVMREIDAFVAEQAADFVDLVQAADDELLEEEFRRDSQVHVHVVIVVVRDEWLGRRATRDGVHDGCLNLHEHAVVEKLADVGDHARTRDESLPAALVHDQI